MAFFCGAPAPCNPPKVGGFTWAFHQRPISCFAVLMASYSKGSSRTGKSSRVTRPCKSNADLCKELKEFILSVGLPPNRVPSMKELSQHGREDLANIVRRRGYKLIGELLRSSTETDIQMETSSAVKVDFTNEFHQHHSEGQDDKSVLPEGGPFSSKPDIYHTCSPNGLLHSKLENICEEEPSSCVSLHEKAARFIRTGELEAVEGSMESEDTVLPVDHDSGYELESSVAETNHPIAQLNGLMGITTANPGEGSLGDLFARNSDYSMSNDGSKFPPALYPSRQQIWTNDESTDSNAVEQMPFEVNKIASQHEIDQLKAMLHQKEIELLELKQQIENEKVALSVLQVKAKKEIDKATKLISEKDALLNSLEENLAGLREVQIEYHGDGAVVEVAGSFNGWHHPARMEPDATSAILNTSGSRSPLLWSTILWLYPGIYEIKFIVDGIWKVDTQQECVKHGYLENNILRVDK